MIPSSHGFAAETLETLKAELAVARAKAADDAAMITQQKLEIAKLSHSVRTGCPSSGALRQFEVFAKGGCGSVAVSG